MSVKVVISISSNCCWYETLHNRLLLIMYKIFILANHYAALIKLLMSTIGSGAYKTVIKLMTHYNIQI